MLSCIYIAAAIALLQPPAHPEWLLPMLDSADPQVYSAAVAQLARSGPTAIPLLRQLIADDFRPDRYRFLDTLVQASGKANVGELERLLRDEQVFWHNLGMNLDEDAKVPQPRLQFLVELLNHLNRCGYRDPHGLVLAVRDQFRDHPLLCQSRRTIAAAESILARP